MNTILLGNIVSFIGCGIMVCIGLIKDKDKVIRTQCLQLTFMGAANLILGGITGFITNMVCIIRNLYMKNFKYSIPVKIVFCGIQVGLAYMFNKSGAIGWIPIVANVIFTWFLDAKTDWGLKIVIIASTSGWLIYDFFMINYVGVVFDVLALAANGFMLFRILYGLKKEVNE